MNQLELKYAIIYYNIEDEREALKISNNDRFKDIVNYFEIKKNINKAIIRIWNNYEKFSDFWKEKYKQNSSPNTLTGFCYEHNHIEIINLKNYIKIKKIKNQEVDFNDWYNLIIHEFTHYCAKEYTNYTLGTKWIQEGLAINLSHQRYFEFEITSSLEDIQNNKCTYNDAYTLMKYVMETYNHEFVLNFLIDKRMQEKTLIEAYNKCKK